MAKTFAGVTEEYAKNNLQWVIKYVGYREVATGAELNARGKWWEEEDIRDVDVAAKQADPAMQHFLDEWRNLEQEHGWMTLQELFEQFAE